MPRWICPVTVVVACASLFASPAFAAPPIYRIIWQRSGYGTQYNVSQSTPFQHADSYPVPDGFGAISPALPSARQVTSGWTTTSSSSGPADR